MWTLKDVEKYRLAWMRPNGCGPKLFYSSEGNGLYCIHAKDGTEIEHLSAERLVAWLNEKKTFLVW